MSEQEKHDNRSAEEAARLLQERMEYLRRRDLLRLVEEQLKQEKHQQRRESYRWN